MAVLAALCGFFAALGVFAVSSRTLNARVVRRFHRGRSILRLASAASMFIVFATVAHFLWFLGNTWTAAGVLILSALVVLGLLVGTDLLRRSRRPAVKKRSFLAIAIHPGDLVTWCGATLADLHDAGHAVHVVVLSDGRQPRQSLIETSRELGDFLGCSSLLLGNLPADQLPAYTGEITDLLRTQIERRDPGIIIAPTHRDPDPDRARIGSAVLQVSDPWQSLITFGPVSDGSPDHVRDTAAYTDVKAHALGILLRNPGPVAGREEFQVVRTGEHGLF